MNVTLIDSMGTDLSVVNAARVSMDKESAWEYDNEWIDIGEFNSQYVEVRDTKTKRMSSGDAKLIAYLARHNHWTPFGHTALSFRIAAPIFVARQLFKHTVGVVANEVSRRYVDSAPTFHEPTKWRKKAENVKQGSSDELVDGVWWTDPFDETRGAITHADILVNKHNAYCMSVYKALLAANTCPEQARMVLPQSMMTEWIWTGNVASFARICKLRLDPHAQKETQLIAQLISDEIKKLFPVSWAALMEKQDV